MVLKAKPGVDLNQAGRCAALPRPSLHIVANFIVDDGNWNCASQFEKTEQLSRLAWRSTRGDIEIAGLWVQIEELSQITTGRRWPRAKPDYSEVPRQQAQTLPYLRVHLDRPTSHRVFLKMRTRSQYSNWTINVQG